MIKLRFISVTLGVLIFAGCRKEEPANPGSEDTPVFSFQGTLNNAPVFIQAGKNNYYMYSNWVMDSNNVAEFSGELKSYGCVSACANSLKVRIRAVRAGSLPGSAVDSSLIPGYYPLAVPKYASSKYSAIFRAIKSFPMDTSAKFSWDFGDGLKGTGDSVFHIYQKPGNYVVSYSISNGVNGCSRTVSNLEKIGPAGPGCRVDFNALDTGLTVLFNSSVTNGSPPYAYSWDFGDGSFGSAVANPAHTYSTTGVFRVKLDVKDSLNTVSSRSYDVSVYAGAVCMARYVSTITGISNPLNASSVILEWTDANGVVYSSYNDLQPAGYTCQILSSEPYQKNSDGQATRKIRMKATCRLYNKSNTWISLDNADIVFAVAHP